MKVRKEKLPKKEYFSRLWQLFVTFLKIGAFTFGGGYAMIGLITKEVVEKKKWVSEEEMLDMTAIAEATPGVIALNTATFVGAKTAGFWGALLASVAVLLPSMVIITIIGYFINKFMENDYIRWAFLGIRAAVAALILNAVLKLAKPVEKNLFSFLVFACALTLALLSSFRVIQLDVVFIILAAALAGILFGIARNARAQKKALPAPPIGEEISVHEEIEKEEDAR